MKHEHVNEIKAILILAASLILLASLVSFVPEDLPWYTSHPNVPAHNLVRIVGAYMAGALFFIFGYSAYAPAVFLSLWSWNKFASRDLNFSLAKLICIVILFCSLSGLFSLFGPNAETYRFQRSGVIGFVLSDFLLQYSGRTGASIILLTITSLTMIVIGEFLISPIVLKCVESFRAFLVKFHGKVQTKIPSTPFKFPPRPELKNARINEKTKAWLKEKESVKPLIKNIKSAEEPAAPIQKLFAPKSVAGKIEKPKIHIATPPKEEAAVIQEKPKVVGNYQIPSPDLLDDPPAISSSRLEDNLVAGAKILEETLSDFNVSVRVADIERGPVITRYELEPAPGVKVQRIITLADDIALALKATSVRIVAPIPGKNRVGIEVPNGASASVYLKDVISHSDFINSESRLTLAIGKDIAGKPIIADLTEMPHLLIAGTTGSGKTVCVNSLIMSMLFHASPDQVKFLMVDPKMVELTQYNGLPHCLCPAVTDYKKVASALNWVVSEMESRYTTLSKEGVRNIKGYHAKGLTMPYIVVIIDELADLMQVAAKTIESA